MESKISRIQRVLRTTDALLAELAGSLFDPRYSPQLAVASETNPAR